MFASDGVFGDKNVNMDIISELGIKTGHSLVVSKIFSYLDVTDLQNVTLVSEKWKQLCYFDRASAKRLRKFMAKRKRWKENSAFKPNTSIQSSNESTPVKKRVLTSWNVNYQYQQNRITITSPTVSPSKARFNLFIKEAKKLNKTGKLTPCPKCTLPSNVNEEEDSGRCTKESCSFYFCLRCQCAYHMGTNCKYFITSSPTSSPSKVPRYTACTRQSRKALRRL